MLFFRSNIVLTSFLVRVKTPQHCSGYCKRNLFISVVPKLWYAYH